MAIAGSISLASAQGARGPNPNAPRLMVSACRTSDKALAIQCADKLRAQIEGDVSYRALYVLPKADVENTLSASGYDPSAALAPGDASALAKQIRADVYIDATLEKTGAGFKLIASLVPQRDYNLVQPLGSWENAKLDGVMGAASKAFQDAHNKTFERQKNCASLSRERKYGDASKEANDGIKDYANSTWLRYCQLGILKDQKAPNEQVIKLAEEILVIDPLSKGALQELVTRYDAMGNKEKKIEKLIALQKADPTNPRLNADIANELAGMGDFTKAKPIVEKALAENPGDMTLAHTYWLILGATKEYKKALEVGDEMVKMDTSAADTAYFSRSIQYALAAGDTTKAADIAHRAGTKFPKVIEYPRFEAGMYSKMPGKTAEANAAVARVLAINPKEPGMRAAVAKAQLAAGQIDAAIATSKQMIAAGEDKNLVAGVAVQAGNVMRTQADSLKGKSDPATVKAAVERAYATTAWADSLATGTSLQNEGKFIMGVSALGLGQIYLTEAGDIGKKLSEDVKAIKPPDAAKQKALVDVAYPQACALANKADEFFTIASGAVPAGGKFNPQAAQQVMGSLQQLNGYVEGMRKAYCKK
jgi:tetratricopeptide (TPR) repeat protein